MNDEQEEVHNSILSSDGHAFITGPGGVGKTFLLHILIESLRRNGQRVSVTATTGVAATLHTNGRTIHSWASMGCGDKEVREYARRLRWRGMEKARKRILDTTVLVIDEASMLTPIFFDKLDRLCRTIRKRSDIPFGGIRVIMVGDFFQLGPILKDASGSSSRHIFQTETWTKMSVEIFVLTTCVRQESDRSYAEILNRIRLGELTDTDRKKLESRRDREAPNGVAPTYLCCYNRQVDAINQRSLRELSGDSHTFEAETTIVRQPEKPNSRKRRALLDACAQVVPKSLELKNGAQIMITRNDTERNLVNGSRGVVTSLPEDGDPVVRFTDGRELSIPRISTEIDLGDRGCVKATYYPMKCAWALSVHKAQGATLDAAVVNVGNAFAPGQAYVALSRVTKLKGLYVTGSPITARSVSADPDVVRWWRAGMAGANAQQRRDGAKGRAKKRMRRHIRDYFSPTSSK